MTEKQTHLPQKSTLRLGSGAGFGADRLDPALRLLAHGKLDWIGFECLAERTLAQGQAARDANPEAGYNRFLEARLSAALPLLAAHGTRLISNMGAANPLAAARHAQRLIQQSGLPLRVAALTGDDVRDLLTPDTEVADLGIPLRELPYPLLSANAYLGVEQLLPAIETGADIILTGRVADPSLFLAPLVHHFGWALDDWQRLGQGTVAGHLLECAGQVTGGYFADPPYRDVPGLDNLGFPFADITDDGHLTLGKLAEDGGLIDQRTVTEQLFYEVHDPTRYLTPDVTADFSALQLTSAGKDSMTITGGSGTARPDTLKVTLGFKAGFTAEGGISYAGPNAVARAKLARDILQKRLKHISPLRIDIIGLAALHATVERHSENLPEPPTDVRLHVAARSDDEKMAEQVLWEIEALYTNGPAGGGGVRGHIEKAYITHDAYIPRSAISPEVEVF